MEIRGQAMIISAKAGVVAGLTMCMSTGQLFAQESPDDRQVAVRQAIEKSLPFLERDGKDWMAGKVAMQHGRSCVSCHHVSFAIWSHHEAERAGISGSREKVRELTQAATSFVSDPEVAQIVTWSHLMLAHADIAVDELVRQRFQEWQSSILQRMSDKGYWEAGGQFPTQKRPEQESNDVATMWMYLGLTAHADGSDWQDVRSRVERWLGEAEPGESTESAVWRVLFEQARGGQDRQLLQKQLFDLQNADGGWSWLAGNESDAFTTGQAVYALDRLGLAATHPQLCRAVDFLLAGQQPDGTWQVASKLVSAEPTDGKDYIYRYWGTAWASIGLSSWLASSPLG